MGSVSWSGSVHVEPGRLVFGGSIGHAHAHAHAAFQLMIITSGAVRLTDRTGAGTVVDTAALVPTGAVHTVEPIDLAEGLMVYIDGSGAVGHRLLELGQRVCGVGAWIQAGSAVAGLRAEIATREPVEAADLAMTELVGDVRRPGSATAVHPSVRHSVELLPSLISEPVTLTDVAHRVHLSASRLGRLFNEQLGLSFPAYVRWTRLMCAMDHVRAGANMTQAAHAAGFTDSAHANRVCHEMFGLAPSALVGSLRWS
jgi:AraC-like DNA-binding protein